MRTTCRILYMFRLIAILMLLDSFTDAQNDVIQGPPQQRKSRWKRRTSDSAKFDSFTKLINSMLDPKTYDMQLRPDFGGAPVDISVNMNVRSMGPISEVDSMFQMDCYFRQSWYDRRLSFSTEIYNGSMLLSTHVLEKMWSPDTYISNGRGSYLHTISVPNMYIRIDPDGKISWSQRLTIKSICPMDLKQYPLDYQTCKIYVGSFGYKREDLAYVWTTGNNKSITQSPNITMAQFIHLYTTVSTGNKSRMNNHGHEVYYYRPSDQSPNDFATILETSFHMKRDTGYYLLNFYIPCSMLVTMSWVTFWLNREASAARVSLGILTFLTMVTISISSRNDLPKLSYITALDLYILMSMGYVLAAFVEYAGVNYFTKIIKPDDCKPIYAFRPDELMPPSPPPMDRMSKKSCFVKFMYCFLSHIGYRSKLKAHKNDMNSVSKIDLVARILFPISFIVLNILYYIAYVHIGIFNLNQDGINH